MRLWLSAFLLLVSTSLAPAQDTYPSRPVTMLLAYAPGGSADLVGRALAKAMERHIGQPVVVQNRGGAAGAIGTQAASIAAPDGYTFLVGSVEIAMLPVVDEMYGRKPTYRREDFLPVARVAADPNFLAVNAERKWRTLKDLIDDARQNPNSIIYTSGGLYGATHLPVEMLLRAANVTMRHLPAAGGGAAMVAVLGNHAGLLAVHPGVVKSHVTAGKVRVLASWGTERAAGFADVPTFRELGYDIEHLIWWGVFVPKGTPASVVANLRQIVAKAVTEPEFAQTLERASSNVAYQDRDAFAPWWEANSRRLEDAVRTMGKPQ